MYYFWRFVLELDKYNFPWQVCFTQGGHLRLELSSIRVNMVVVYPMFISLHSFAHSITSGHVYTFSRFMICVVLFCVFQICVHFQNIMKMLHIARIQPAHIWSFKFSNWRHTKSMYDAPSRSFFYKNCQITSHVSAYRMYKTNFLLNSKN